MHSWNCVSCGISRPEDPSVWRCACGGPYRLAYEPSRLEPRRLAGRAPDMWRYREALPVHNWHERVSLGEGLTPITGVVHRKIPFLAKLDYLTPTGSFKDRGASLLMTWLSMCGIRRVVEDSSGNAGAAIACYAARARIRATIYVPEHASPGKIQSIAAFRAELARIRGSRSDVADAVVKAAGASCYASHVWNPYFIHGTKTCAYEIAEQLGWKSPDWIVAPAGSGTLLIGLHIGFVEMRALGLIDRLPRLAAAQPRNCNPLERHCRGQGYRAPKRTVAEGAAVGRPARLQEMAQVIEESRGRVYSTRESRIIPAMQDCWSSGIYVEPTSALALAALEDLASEEDLGRSKVVVVFTGSGLKFPMPQEPRRRSR